MSEIVCHSGEINPTVVENALGRGRAGRGRNRVRSGRGGRGGRGRGRYLEAGPAIAPLDDSGDDEDVPSVPGDDMQLEFARLYLLDGESDEGVAEPQDEPEVEPDRDALEPEPVARSPFQVIPSDRLGDPSLTLSYPFEKGTNENTLERYRAMSPTDIVLDLALPFFNVLRDCSNNNERINISMKDMFCYHASSPGQMMSTNFCPIFRSSVSITFDVI